MKFFDSIRNILIPKPVDAAISPALNTEPSLNLIMIIDEIVYAFEESVRAMSTPRTIIFHTAYVAYVPEGFYNELQLTFGILTQEIVEEFNIKLKELLAKGKNKKIRPLSNYWSFDLIPVVKGGIIDEEGNPITSDELDEKFVAVRSSLVADDLFKFTAAEAGDTIKTNKTKPASTFQKMQCLSLDAIAGLKPNGKGYTYPINLNAGQLTDSPDIVASDKKSLAVLECADFNTRFTDKTAQKYERIDIRLNNFYVGGPSAEYIYAGCPVVHLTSESVMNPHLEIKRESNGHFYIRPIGPVELNELGPVPQNQWTPLPDKNTSIKINGDIELIFNKK